MAGVVPPRSRSVTPTSEVGSRHSGSKFSSRRSSLESSSLRSRSTTKSRRPTNIKPSENRGYRASLHRISEFAEKRERRKQVKVVESNSNDFRIFRGQHREFDKMDETSKFLASVPKTLPNQVDAKAKERLSEEQARLQTDIALHRESQAVREETLLVKQQAFRNAIKRFDHFIEDMEKKELRARETCRRLRIERLELSIKLRSLKKQAATLQREREQLFKAINPLSKVADFMRAVANASDGQYKQPESLVIRHAALTKSSKRLMCRYNYNNERLEALRDMNDVLTKTGTENILDMRNQITILKNQLTQVTDEKHELSKYLEQARERFVEKDTEMANIRMSITNIVGNVMNFRPFTHGRMKEEQEPISQIEKIGEIIEDYELIVASIKKDTTTEKQTTATKKKVRQKEAPVEFLESPMDSICSTDTMDSRL